MTDKIEQLKQILQRRSTYCKECVSWDIQGGYCFAGNFDHCVLAQQIDALYQHPISQLTKCFVQCSRCGKQVSNAVESYLKEGLIVRAWVECADCVEKDSQSQTSIIKAEAYRAGIKKVVDVVDSLIDKYSPFMHPKDIALLNQYRQSKLKEWGVEK
jgi:hypothetical protein